MARVSAMTSSASIRVLPIRYGRDLVETLIRERGGGGILVGFPTIYVFEKSDLEVGNRSTPYIGKSVLTKRINPLYSNAYF